MILADDTMQIEKKNMIADSRLIFKGFYSENLQKWERYY